MKNISTVALVAAILLFVNLLSRQYFVRLDVTQDRQYTLSKATKDILNDLDETVTITAYFTGSLPQQFTKTKRDFQDLLEEYNTRSRGMVNYEFIDPNIDTEKEQEAIQNGVSPLLINVREKDESVQKKAFMGAVVRSGEQQDVIPLIQPEGAMEYGLTTSIKKVSSLDKATIGIIQGHGETPLDQLGLVAQSLSILYNLETIDFNSNPEVPTHIKALVLLNPSDTIPPAHFAMIDKYLSTGGNLCVAFNAVEGDFQTVQGLKKHTGITGWLQSRSINVDPSFIVDASCGSISVQQRQGMFTFNSAVSFPYFPLVNNFGDHPITKGIEQIVFQFASPINFLGDSLSQYTPLLRSSEQSGILNAPISFNIEKQWGNADFPMSNLTLGAILQHTEANGLTSKLIVFSDGDFLMGSQGRSQTPDNVSLIVNSIDWLADDTGLIDLRTKGVTTRPIKDMEDGKKASIKWVNFLLPIILVIVYGIYRSQRNRRKRLKRMAESYL